jgi:hypothetical protein
MSFNKMEPHEHVIWDLRKQKVRALYQFAGERVLHTPAHATHLAPCFPLGFCSRYCSPRRRGSSGGYRSSDLTIGTNKQEPDRRSMCPSVGCLGTSPGFQVSRQGHRRDGRELSSKRLIVGRTTESLTETRYPGAIPWALERGLPKTRTWELACLPHNCPVCQPTSHPVSHTSLEVFTSSEMSGAQAIPRT